MGNPNFSQVFKFAILCYRRNSWKLDVHKKSVFYSMIVIMMDNLDRCDGALHSSLDMFSP